jgi:hypothetical protein
MTKPFQHNDATQPMTPERRGWRALALRYAIAAAMLLGTAAAIFATREGPVIPSVAKNAPIQLASAAPVEQEPITGQFVRFALNALLVPLLDDHKPPQWTDVALHHFCGPRTYVEVNGLPLVPATIIPAGAFHVRWYIDQCWPLGYSAFELSGTVDLLVSHEDAGLSAIVNAQGLRIAAAKGAARLSAPFPATMALGGAKPLPQEP